MIKKLEVKYKHPGGYWYHMIFLFSDYSFETGEKLRNSLQKYEYFHLKGSEADMNNIIPIVSLFEFAQADLYSTTKTTDFETYKDWVINDLNNTYGELIEEPVWEDVVMKEVEVKEMFKALKNN